MGKRFKVGTVIELNTKIGYAYIQLSHEHKRYGMLFRILDGVFPAALHDQEIAELVNKPERYVNFCCMDEPVTNEQFRFVFVQPVPDFAKPFPMFKTGNRLFGEEVVPTWWLWDGEETTHVDKLTAEQRKFPFLAIWNEGMLIYKIEHNWKPENEGF